MSIWYNRTCLRRQLVRAWIICSTQRVPWAGPAARSPSRTVGLGAYIVDGALAVYKGGLRFVSSAERRGQRMSRDFTRRFGDFEEHAVSEMRKLQDQVDENVDHLRGGFIDAKSSADEDLEKRVELVLSNMGLPSRERLERLSMEIDELNRKLDQQLRRLPDRPIPDPLG